MGFYDLPKEQRAALAMQIREELDEDFNNGSRSSIIERFSDPDTYIRKAAYLAVGRISQANPSILYKIIPTLEDLLSQPDFKIRQTCINAAGEIGKFDFAVVEHFFDKGLFDSHHAVRNAVIGSIKKMGEVNPKPVLEWAKRYLHHADKEIRREVCHGIELRGRKFPQDILPLLKELQFDKTSRVSKTLVHVIGQIAYKKGCLATVVADLKTWDNKELVKKALEEIIDVHHRYRNFSTLSQAEAVAYIKEHY